MAYFYSDLDEKIYIKQPKGSRLSGKKRKSDNFTKYYMALSKPAYQPSLLFSILIVYKS